MRTLSSRNYFGKTEICNFNMSVYVNKNIFRFNISINNVVSVKILKSEQQLRKVKACLVLSKFLNFSEVKEHFAASAQVHDKEQLCLGLKRPV